jgi:PAS domain S-box-containing protein
MDEDDVGPYPSPQTALVRWARAAIVVVLFLTVLDWVGWATGIDQLTRFYPGWPQMTPWTALWLALLGAAILMESSAPSLSRVWAQRGLVVAVGVIATIVLAEYLTARTFGVDQMWFGESVRKLQSTWPGRPSPQTTLSVLLMSAAVGLRRPNRPWIRVLWGVCLGAGLAIPCVTVLAYLFDAIALVKVAPSTGMAMGTALGLLLLGVAAMLVRPDRGLVGWLHFQPNRRTVVRLIGVIATFPILVGLSRRLFLYLGMGADAGLALSTAVGTAIVGAATFYISQREQRQLEAAQSDRALLRASAGGMLSSQVVFEASRDRGGRVVDFVFRSANLATYSYLGLGEDELLGRTALEIDPNLEASGLMEQYRQCLYTGEPLILNDFRSSTEILDGERILDIRATRAGVDMISVGWSDVTERFRAAQHIAASEERYRLLAENVGDVVCHLRDGKFVWISPSVEAKLGAPPEHWLGRGFADFIPPEDVSTHAPTWKELAEGGSIKTRVRVVATDGVFHWFHLHAKPFYDADGRPDGVEAALRLVDDEVTAEQAVEESNRQRAKADERYRRAVDSAAIGMCLITPDGRFLEVNDSLCRFFGYDAETLTQKTWQQLTSAEYLNADLDNFTGVLEGRLDSYRIVKQYIHADGRLIWGDLSVSCTRYANGDVDNFISQIIDITAEVAARDELRERDERNHELTQRLQEEADRTATELVSAASYITSILPDGLRGRVAVASYYLPSQQLGGDCFDYRWIDEDHLLVYLIDVSGHGIESALLSVSLQNLLRSGAIPTETLLAPHSLLAELNRQFPMNQQRHHYFTIWYGVYNASTRTLRYASAGHPPAYVFNPGIDKAVGATELTTNSLPIGMFDDSEFSSHVFSVPHSCQILLYSDGATELALADGRQWSPTGFKNLTTRLARSRNWSLDELVEDLRALTPTGDFEDDCSLVQLTFA